jgi:hypothetical protein
MMTPASSARSDGLLVVDTLATLPEGVASLRGLTTSLASEMMRDAGARLMSSVEVDHAVTPTLEITWSCESYAAWNVIRRNLVLDPRFYRYERRLRPLLVGGTRRFHPSWEQSSEDGHPPASEGVTLRRVEAYEVVLGAVAGRFHEALLGAPSVMADLEHSVVGSNRSSAAISLVWEHAFAGPQAYGRYMTHPYHADAIDRYLLCGAPERAVADSALGAGLFGYHCAGTPFVMSSGVRRFLLLALDPARAPEAERAWADAVGGWTAEVSETACCLLAPNVLGGAWFDGVTPIGPPPRWSYVLEQGFEDDAALASYLGGESRLARAERTGLAAGDGMVQDVLELYYDIVSDP